MHGVCMLACFRGKQSFEGGGISFAIRVIHRLLPACLHF
jgi:hypothetical protein